jgi:2'-5' RNA ligase
VSADEIGGAAEPFGGPSTMSMPAIRDRAVLDGVTVGVVIDLPDPWQTELSKARAEFGDPDAANIPPHITLLPPTEISRGDMGRLLGHLARVAGRAVRFTVRLKGTATFRPVSPVVFVRIERGAGGCDLLQQQIRSGPILRPLEFPYHPHVTVAHNLDEPTLDHAQQSLAGFQATFEVAEFWLYQHVDAGIWEPRDRFELAAQT